MKFLCTAVNILLTIEAASSIECKFRFIENVPNYPKDDELSFVDTMTAVNKETNLQPFDCVEEAFEEDEIVESRIDTISHDFETTEADDYESVVVCATRNRTLHPKALNSVRNQMVSVVNTNEIVQAIKTEECLFPRQSCAEFSTKRVQAICVQKYVRIYLKAFNRERKVYDEEFYFPSLCACDLIKVKER